MGIAASKAKDGADRYEQFALKDGLVLVVRPDDGSDSFFVKPWAVIVQSKSRPEEVRLFIEFIQSGEVCLTHAAIHESSLRFIYVDVHDLLRDVIDSSSVVYTGLTDLVQVGEWKYRLQEGGPLIRADLFLPTGDIDDPDPDASHYLDMLEDTGFFEICERLGVAERVQKRLQSIADEAAEIGVNESNVVEVSDALIEFGSKLGSIFAPIADELHKAFPDGEDEDGDGD